MRDSSIAVTYNADGCLRVWDCLGRVCLQKITVLELLGLAAEGQGGVSVEGWCTTTTRACLHGLCYVSFAVHYLLCITVKKSLLISRLLVVSSRGEAGHVSDGYWEHLLLFGHRTGSQLACWQRAPLECKLRILFSITCH